MHCFLSVSVLSVLVVFIGVASGEVSRPAIVLQRQCDAAAALGELRGGGAAGCDPATTAAAAVPTGIAAMHPVLLALLGTSFGWFMTALGSAAVVIHKLGLDENTYRRVLDFMLGISGGVMIAASFWSLLAPALEVSCSVTALRAR